MQKICNKCGFPRDLEDFHKTYEKKKDGTSIGDGRRTHCRLCDNLKRKKLYDKRPATRMLMNAKSRSRQHKIPFNITLDDVPIPEYCPILRIKLCLGTKTNYAFSPSIDRINSDLGYVKGNVKVVSLLANRMKSNATKEECLEFAKNIKNYFD